MKKALEFLGPHVEAGARMMLWLFLALAALFFLIHAGMQVVFRYPLDYGEAPLVDQAMRLAAGENIYRRDISTPPYTISNYPPLYMLLLVPFVKLFGPTFWAGRVLAALSTLVTSAGLGLIVHTHTRNRGAALTTALLFLAFPYVVGWSALLRVDMLALALSVIALYVISRWPTTPRGLGITAGLLIAAAYTKQSYGLAAPMAAFFWLWGQDRRQAFKLTGLVAGGGLAILLILNLITQGGFVFNIITANVNPFEMHSLKRHAMDLLKTLPMLLILSSVFLFFLPGGPIKESETQATETPKLSGSRAWPLITPYLIGGLISASTIGKVGSNINYLLELCAGLTLATGMVLAWSATAWQQLPTASEDDPARFGYLLRLWWPLLRGVLLILLALQIAFMMRATLTRQVEQTKWRLKPIKDLEYMEWLVEQNPEPILADEFMGMLTLQKRPLYLQPFEMTQLANAGKWDQTPLLQSIRDQAYPYIFIHHFMGYPVYQTRWTQDMLSAIMTHYAPTHFLAETLVYQPSDADTAQFDACPDAPWPLPTRSELGMWWISKQLAFMGEGTENTIPVYAVADGMLMRRADWLDAVAIRHADPLRPGEEVWVYYSGMAGDNHRTSFVVPDFPPGSEELPVTQGQLLGYQGQYWDQGTLWVHASVAILPVLDDGSFPAALLGLADPEAAPLPYEIEEQGFLNPSPYLGTIRSQVMGEPVWLPPQCE